MKDGRLPKIQKVRPTGTGGEIAHSLQILTASFPNDSQAQYQASDSPNCPNGYNTFFFNVESDL